jgi:hypothetical protein
MLRYSRKKPNLPEFWECKKYTCYYYFDTLDKAVKFMEIQTDFHGDNEWYLSHWKNGVKTLLSGRKITKRVTEERPESSKPESSRPLTKEFDLEETLKYLAGGK